MLQNSGSSWRDRVRAKSAIVAIHLLSVISSIRLYVGPLEGALNVLALRYHQVAWSRVYLWIVALRECQESLTPFCFPHFGDSWQKLQRGDARCRFADFLLCFVIAALRPSTEEAAAVAPFNPSYLGRQTGL